MQTGPTPCGEVNILKMFSKLVTDSVLEKEIYLIRSAENVHRLAFESSDKNKKRLMVVSVNFISGFLQTGLPLFRAV